MRDDLTLDPRVRRSHTLPVRTFTPNGFSGYERVGGGRGLFSKVSCFDRGGAKHHRLARFKGVAGLSGAPNDTPNCPS